MNEQKTFEHDDENEKRSPKGFYIALALCVLAIIGVALILFVDTDDVPMGDATITSTTTVGTTVTTTDRAVAGVVTGVPDTRTTTTIVTTQTTEKQQLFVLPASNVILREYSDKLVYSETLGEWRTHNGVDFEVKEDATIKAIADGTVSSIETDTLWGEVIVIDHGDKLVSRYCGVSASGISVGQTVKAGDIIGSVSDIPSEIVDAPHIHVEVLANGKYVDPMTLMKLN